MDLINGSEVIANEEDRASDYINVLGWDVVTIRAQFSNVFEGARPWANVCFYTIDKEFIETPFDGYVGNASEDIIWHIRLGVYDNVSFIRVSINYYDSPVIDVKVSINKGNIENPKYYIAPEDVVI